MKRSKPKILLIGAAVVLFTLIIAPMQLFAEEYEGTITGMSIIKGDCGKIGVKLQAGEIEDPLPYSLKISSFDGSVTFFHFTGTASGGGWNQTYHVNLEAGHYRAYASTEYGGKYKFFSVAECTNSIDFTPAGCMKQLFKGIFGRTPTDEELQALVDKMSEGMSAADIVRELIFSEENQERLSSFSNDQFIQFLYNVVLLREPEAEGLAAWLARMDAGMTMEEVLDGFLAEEFGEMCSLFGI